MKYLQFTDADRNVIAALRQENFSQADIARHLGRHVSTVSRELYRNKTTHDGAYRPSKAIAKASGRKHRSRKKSQFSKAQWTTVTNLLVEKYSPEQISGALRRDGELSISHETIYRHIRADRRRGGLLFNHLRQARKQKRKRYRGRDSRGVLQGKRMIGTRPKIVETRAQFGHWEIDTIMGPTGCTPCALTMVERKTGFLMLGKLKDKSMQETASVMTSLIQRAPKAFRTLTADNGTEFHAYKEVEKVTNTRIYFATPYHSWERGTNENTNGLLRQYLPKGVSMKHLTQRQCDEIAHQLNSRPRKRHAFRSPADLWPANL